MQAPRNLLAIGVLGHEGKKIEIALRVAHHAGEIIELKQTQVTMIILDAFLLQLSALFRGQLVILSLFLNPCRAQLMINEQRLATMRSLAIGPASRLHLQNAEIDSQLQFLTSIEPQNLAHLDRASLMRPILQNRVQIQAHREK